MQTVDLMTDCLLLVQLVVEVATKWPLSPDRVRVGERGTTVASRRNSAT